MKRGNSRIVVNLIQFGEYLPKDLNLSRFARKLNRLQSQFEFNAAEKHVEIDGEKLTPSLSGLYFADEIITAAATPSSTEPDIVDHYAIIVTTVRITSRPMNQQDNARALEEDWLGVWNNRFVQLPPNANNSGVISLALWMKKYQEEAYRTTSQYLAYMVVAFLGDQLYRGGLTHPDFRWCVFDLNDDMDSIPESIKKSRISIQSKKDMHRLVLVNLHANIHIENLIGAFEKMLLVARRPTLFMIFRYLNDNSVTSFFVVGLLLSLSLQPLTGMLSTSAWVSLLMAATFAGIVVKERFWPSDKLG